MKCIYLIDQYSIQPQYVEKNTHIEVHISYWSIFNPTSVWLPVHTEVGLNGQFITAAHINAVHPIFMDLIKASIFFNDISALKSVEQIIIIKHILDKWLIDHADDEHGRWYQWKTIQCCKGWWWCSIEGYSIQRSRY